MFKSEVCLISDTRLGNAVVDAEENLEEQGKQILADPAGILTAFCRCSGYLLYPPFSTQTEVLVCLIPNCAHCSVFPCWMSHTWRPGNPCEVPNEQMSLISNLNLLFFFLFLLIWFVSFFLVVFFFNPCSVLCHFKHEQTQYLNSGSWRVSPSHSYPHQCVEGCLITLLLGSDGISWEDMDLWNRE